MIVRSFRVRILVATVLWTFGLLGLTHVTFMVVARFHPALFRVGPHAILVFGVVFMAAGLLLVRVGFSRIGTLRKQLTAVREGQEQRIEGLYPTEVQPLVTELNALLDHRAEAVRRAVAKAGDLAHGLKTPLAVIAHEGDRLAAAGQHEAATAIRQQVERMQRQIDLHLAHTRAAGSGATLGSRCLVADSVEALIRTVDRIYASRGLAIRSDGSPDHAVRVQREDLDEMLGNLLDNACKWAQTRIVVGSTLVPAGDSIRVAITVDDDGPGLDPALCETVLQRGVRADEAAPGSGLGLAIVQDLAAVYGGSITLGRSPMGGLRAKLDLPAGV